MKKLLIFPFNGNAIEAVNCLGNNFELIGFIDDSPDKAGTEQFGYKIFSRLAIYKYQEAKIIAVPGNPKNYLKRDEIIESLNIPFHRFATIIHPAATVSPLAVLGSNVLIMAGTVVTSNSLIGNHVCILPNTVIHHDTRIGNYSLIGSNVTIAGYSEIGNKCYIGSASNIINNICIGSNTIVGLGANVIKSFPVNSKIAGNPAKPL